MKKANQGQSLVEFSLIVPIFLILMVALFDATRLVFQYNELQQAARVGARWGAINVNRDGWGTFSFNNGDTPSCIGGSASGCTATSDYYANSNLTVTGGVTPTIVGQVSSSLVGIPNSQTIVNISQPPSSYPNCQLETGLTVGSCSGMPITVTVSYTFVPILSFSMVHIPLQGRAVAFHE